MTTPILPPEAHLLVILGEVRGDVKGIAKSLASLETRIHDVESAMDTRVGALGARITALETYKTKVAGFTIGLALVLTLTKDKLPALATFIFGG